jgi:hypothetical protein
MNKKTMNFMHPNATNKNHLDAKIYKNNKINTKTNYLHADIYINKAKDTKDNYLDAEIYRKL